MHTTDKPQENTLLQQSVLIIKELKSKLKALEDKQREPIAVVGMGCRFPGAENPGQFWQLLRNGVDAITEVPADRWSLEEYFDEDPAAAGKMYARYGGFIREPRAFDAPFFGISPREAEYLDPQQRLALEVSWQAFEHAGLGANALAGSKTGVYLGICANDYAGLVQDLTRVNAYYGTGNAFSTASGRLSYWFGFHGPSISVDTACSSSLVTVHLACQGLRSGECNLALAGGVGLMLSPKNSINFSKARMLAPDGRCKTFDEAANGYVRGEGCGMVVLKRLSDALADGDRILGLIRGSAVNQDGRSAGLTVPSELAQERVIRSALENANVLPGQVSYVEAHGTGTSLGDPIEMNALGEVFGDRSRAESLLVGSVKTNVGHLEAAAGVAGLIKVLLAMQHGAIPPHLHCRNPSSRIGWNALPLQVPAALTPWETGGKARVAGVSSFSFSGTNAHVVLEEAPVVAPPVPAPGAGRSHHLLTVSARDEKALAELVARYADYVSDAPESLADICHTANGGRSHFDHRLAVVAGSKAELAAKLDALRAAAPGAKATAGKPPRVAFLFTGQGAQYAGMGKELYATHPVFRQAVDDCDRILRGYLRESVVRVLFEAGENEGLIHRTEYTQPALFTLEYALAALWESWGIVPAYLAGHSVGEYVAACRAGVFSLADGLKLIAWRGRLIQSLPDNGGMLTAFAGAGAVEPFVQPYAGRVSVAAVNTARTVVLSGEKAALAVLAADLQRAGIETKKLTVSHAFHSPLMEPVLADFRQVAAGIAYAPPRIPVISNVTGRAVTTEMAGPDYWVNHVTAPVRFADGLAALDRAGVDAFVEIGPAPTLLSLGKRELAGRTAAWLPSLSPHCPAWEVLLESVGTLYAAGQPIDWNAFNGYLAPRKATLPGYPFAGETYWLDEQTTAGPARAPHAGRLHPLIEKCVAAPLHREVLFEAAFGVAQMPFLADHKIYGSVIVPGAAYLSLLLGAGGLSWPGRSFTLSDIVFPQALVLADDEAVRVQVSLQKTGPAAPVQVISYQAGEPDGPFVTHALAKAGVLDPAGPGVYLEVEAIKERCTLRLTGDDIYQAQSRNAIELGTTFRWIQTVYQGGGEALCRMHFPEKLSAADGYQIHPGLIDSCFQLVLAALPEASRHTYVPFKIDQVTYYGRPVQGAGYAYASLRTGGQPADGALTADLELATPAGEVIARFGGVQVRRASPEALLGLARKNTTSPLCYETTWKPAEAGSYPAAAAPVLACLLFADGKGCGEGLAAQLRAAGHDAVCVYKGEAFGQKDDAAFTVDPGCPDDYGRVLTTLGARPGFAVNAVMHLWCLDDELTGAAAPGEPLLHRAQQHGAFSLAHLARALAQAGVHTLRRFALVTRDTQDIAGISRPLQVQHATAWGMGASLAREYPDWHCLNIDLTATYPKDDAYCLYRELTLPYEETQVAYRHGARQIARVTRKPAAGPLPEGKLCRDDATYLVTGGLGALGLLTAAWLAEKGATCLALAGRSGAVSPAATQAIGRLEAAGVRVAVFRCDIADAADAGRLFEALHTAMPPLKGIFHTAGVLDDGLLVNQSVPQLERVMGPKVRGTLHLHKYSRDLELDYFVCYSSIASALGSAGQAAYAAANGFMDGLVRYRNQYGLPTWGVNWGPWAGAGMAASLSAAHQAGLKKQGIGLLDPRKAFAALEQLLRQGPGQSLVADIVWDALAGSQPGPAGRALLAELTTTAPGRDPKADAPVSFAQKLSACLTLKERQDLVLGQLNELVAEVMRLAPHQLDVHKPLNRLGLDSLMAVELKNKVHKQIGVEINVVRFMDDVDLTALGLELYDGLHLPAAPEETPRLTERPAVPERVEITPEMAEQMLENVDAYSEEEMDALLKQLMAKDES